VTLRPFKILFKAFVLSQDGFILLTLLEWLYEPPVQSESILWGAWGGWHGILGGVATKKFLFQFYKLREINRVHEILTNVSKMEFFILVIEMKQCYYKTIKLIFCREGKGWMLKL
jgi:hypothetical protein